MSDTKDANDEKADSPIISDNNDGETLEKQASAVPAEVPSQGPPAPADAGGQGWVVIFGGFCCLFASTGWIYSIGVLQDYYQENQFRHLSPSSIAWAQSFETGLVWFLGPFVGALFSRYGAFPLLVVGTLFHIFGLMMLSLAKEFYQVFLSQGLCSPIGAGLIYNTALFAAPPWFPQRKALAMGIVLQGASLGSIITPILVQHVLVLHGFPWAVRTLAFVYLFFAVVGCFTVKGRFPPNPQHISLNDLTSPFRERTYTITLIAAIPIWMVLFVPYNFMVVQARTAVGMSANLASYILPICNAWSIPGRLIISMLGDKYGRFNMITLNVLAVAIVTLACWIPAHSNAVVLTYASLYGFFIGGYPALAAALVPQITPTPQAVPVRLGLMFLGVSVFMIIGNPIAGAILSHHHGTFWGLQIFAGLFMFLSAVLYGVVRITLVGWKVTAKV
ncbi:MFS general substrate transporter [Rhizodiscina lignyota]|uniref:MFS general substrate transporter n=1 Tax=Rhizodiscina lignyota TaxID=1504668 RepID=A0A9P4IS93_9PEZI|nr:MFS general substrate transporter [Rhizodiscina lignyota]